MPANLLLTSWYTGLGGGETDLLSLAAALDPDQFIPHLLVPADGTLAERWRSHGWPLHIVPYRGASTYFVPAIWARFPVVPRMAQLLQEHKINIISSEYHTLPLIAPAARRLNIPLHWTVHGWWFKPRFWQRAFFRSIPVVARSYAIRDGFLGDPPVIAPDRVPVIYSGVDTDRFHPQVDGLRVRFQANLKPETPLVALVARFQPVKGHHTFQAMARQVALQMPQARFIVAGEDTFGVGRDQLYKEHILTQAHEDPLLRNRLHYLGFRDDVERVLAAADVVVCASEFESYGKVNIEAMACARPVVSTNRGGSAETIVHDKTGLLVAPDDPEALALAVIRLLRDPDLRQRLGHAGRDRVLKQFSARAFADHYAAQFTALMSS